MTSNNHKKPITRHRDHLACIECRRKKLKCDRAAPCSACTRRDGGVSCTYQKSTTGFEAERDRRKKAEGRLEHLEQLVQQMSKTGTTADLLVNGTTSSAASTSAPLHGEPIQDGGSGTHAAAMDESIFSGATHWSAMLEDIEDLKAAMSMPSSNIESTSPPLTNGETSTIDDTAILFGAGHELTFEQILSQYLPSRQESDRLVATYFRSKAVKAPLLHQSHFQRRYVQFWDKPLATSPLWVCILFTIFHATTNSLGSSPANDIKYSTAAAHCLVAGKYHQPKEYAVEALALYAQIKCFTRLDVTADVGIVIGLATRVAIRMGYNRDPERLPISPFEKEMRRRVWSTLLQLDLLISFQLGMPNGILPGSHDTAIPRNLQDGDFDEDATDIPPSRPNTDETDIMFYIAKHQLSTAFEKVLQYVSTAPITSNIPSTSASPIIDNLDAEIKRTYISLPANYREQKPVSASVFDSPTLIVARFCVNMIYEKSLCVLHRPYVAVGRRESVLACYTAATNIIAHFVDAYYEFQPGGQVEMQRWFMSAITWHDFLLGVTALGLVLCSAQRHGLGGLVDSVASVEMMRRSMGPLSEHAEESRDTLKVLRVVERVVQRFAPDEGSGASSFSTGMAWTGSEQHLSAPTSNGTGDPFTDTLPSASMNMDWHTGLAQPMVDESWNWLESFLQDDDAFGINGFATTSDI